MVIPNSFSEVHDELYGVEAVGAEVGDECCFFCYFFGLYTEFVNYDAFHAI